VVGPQPAPAAEGRPRGGWHQRLCPAFLGEGKGAPGDSLCSGTGFGDKVQLPAVRGTAGWFVIKLFPCHGSSRTPHGQRSGWPWCSTTLGAGRAAGQASRFSFFMPHVHTASRTGLLVSSWGREGTGHTLPCPHSPLQHHLLFREHEREGPPTGMHLPCVPTGDHRHFLGMQGNECANTSGLARHPPAPLSYVLRGGSQDAGSGGTNPLLLEPRGWKNLQTSATWQKSSGEDL